MGKMRILLWIASLLFLIKAEKEPLDNLDQLLDDPDIWQYIEKRVEQGNKDQTDDLNQVQGLENESSHPHKNFGDKGQNSENRQSPASKSVTGNVKDLERNHHRFPYFKEESNIGHFLPFSPKAKTISDSSGNSCTYRQNSSLIIRSKKSLENGAAFLKSATHLSSEDCATKCCYTQNCNLAVYEDKEERSCYLFDCGVPSKCLFAPHANYTLMSFHETNSKMGETQQHHENELENLGKTLSPQVQTTLTPAPKIDKVPLYGDCDWGQTCADKNAECRNEQCKCKEGYHAIYAYCRKVCQSDEFQCKNKGQDNKVPDCIDKKHWCDGIPQCADGSDEENCPDQSQDQKDQEFLKKDDDQHKTDRTPSPLPPAVPKEEESGETNEDLDIESNEKEKHEESMKKEDSSEKNKEKKIQEEHEIKPTSKVTPIAKVIKTTDKPSNLDEAADKVLIKSPTDSNQGPIVALALGLGICLMLLIFVGCRLRTVKRRIRRGKSLHSNEADYLINGMYL